MDGCKRLRRPQHQLAREFGVAAVFGHVPQDDQAKFVAGQLAVAGVLVVLVLRGGVEVCEDSLDPRAQLRPFGRDVFRGACAGGELSVAPPFEGLDVFATKQAEHGLAQVPIACVRRTARLFASGVGRQSSFAVVRSCVAAMIASTARSIGPE